MVDSTANDASLDSAVSDGRSEVVPARLLNPERYRWPEPIRRRLLRLDVDEHWVQGGAFYHVIAVLKNGTEIPLTTTDDFNRVALDLVDAFDEAGVEGSVGLAYLTERDRKLQQQPYRF